MIPDRLIFKIQMSTTKWQSTNQELLLVLFRWNFQHLEQWFPTFDGLWPPSRVSQNQWPTAQLENWLSQYQTDWRPNLKVFFPELLLKTKKNRRPSSMFPLIFCALCAQKFWHERTFCGFSQNFVFETKAVFVSKMRGKPQKKVFFQNRSLFVSEIR